MEEDADQAPSPDDNADAAGKALDPLAERDRKIDDLTQTLRRIQAEFENYKKRVAKEWSEKARYASEGIALEMLPILDTLDSAIGDDQGEEDDRTGLAGIRRQLLQVLQRQGLREIRTDGGFDPFEHEALERVERPNGKDSEILEVYQKGYLLGQKVIRTAKVKVAVSIPDTHDLEEDMHGEDDRDYKDGDSEQEER